MSGTEHNPTPKLGEIADRIRAHLKRIEAAQPKDGKATPGRLFMANAWAAGSRVGVVYVSYQGESMLRKADALDYLRWLDAGNEGTHYAVTSFNARIRETPAA
jgi:hypothetical protein